MTPAEVVRHMPSQIPWDKLFDAAARMRALAYAPYSKFQVGAALITDDGSIVGGCNVENASYGLSLCAERNAIGQLVALGKKKVVALALVVDSQQPTPPCGMCRQVIAEFAEASAEIKTKTLKGDEQSFLIGELLPHAFNKSFLIDEK